MFDRVSIQVFVVRRVVGGEKRSYEKKRDSEERGRIPRTRTGTRSQHVEQGSGGDSVRRAAEATESISYGMPMFKYNGLLLGFAAFSNHCSVFPGPAVIEAFKDELEGFTTSKGTIRFPSDKPLSASLVKRLVKARIAQNERTKRR